ncbi:MAG: FkbM family methyltransferase [Thermoleophilia bacterium]
MKTSKDSVIGWLMNVYRNSPFHNAFFGGIFAKILSLVTFYNKKQIVQGIDGITFALDLEEVIDSSLYYSDTFEPKIERMIEKYVKPGMTVIDIGANIGYHTFRMGRLAKPGGMVYAIEPTSWAYTKLIINSELNPKIDNIEFLKIGLAKEDLGEQEITFRSSYRLDGKSDVKKEKIYLKQLDTLIRERKIDRVDFIKLDVDGFEGQVLMGSVETLKTFSPTLIIEITPSEMEKGGTQPTEIMRLLIDLGYSFFDEDQRSVPDLEKHCEQLHTAFSAMILAVHPHSQASA